MRGRRERRSRTTRVDLTPLLDAIFLVIVMLLCLILHMRVVTAINVERPVVRSGGATRLGHDVVLEVAVTRDGQIVLEGGHVSLDQLPARLAGTLGRADACLISADRMARHGRVAQVLVAAKRALATKPIYFEVEHQAPGD